MRTLRVACALLLLITELLTLGPAKAQEQQTSYPCSAEEQSWVTVSLEEKKGAYWCNDRLIWSFPVGVGKSSTPTKQGRYNVLWIWKDPIYRNHRTGAVTPKGAVSPLSRWFIALYQDTDGAYVGFHGTPAKESVGRASSNSCLRLHPDDVDKLVMLLDVTTIVVIY